MIDFDKEALQRRIGMLRDKSLGDEIIRETFDLRDKTGWKLANCRKAIVEDSKWEEKITQILYRPFDVRWMFNHEEVIERSRSEVMRHLSEGSGNLAIVTPRRVEFVGGWRHALAASVPVEHVTVSLKTIDYVFPLYCYFDYAEKDLLNQSGKQGQKKPNLNPALLLALKETYHRQPSPEEVFYYVYAVLYAPTYRKKYADLLKTDFPRVPFTKDQELFLKLAKLGEKLVDLHLLRSKELDKPICRFQGKGDNRVEKQTYSPKEKRVYINKTQYFEGVEPEVWNYQIGGYQVLDKWLKDRKKRIINTDDIKHYCRVVTALAKTIEIQGAIDRLYPEVEKDTMNFSA